jgi:hypothetical protein
MTEHEFLKPALTGLAKLQIALDKQGGPSENGQLFEQILKLQDGILRSFGLPTTTDNEKLVWFSHLPTETELNERIQQLHKKAAEYLLGNTKTELQTLLEAQEQQKDPFEVLPELKITTHTYTIFVYNQILLKKKDTAENILHELKLANHSGLLGAIGNLEQGNIENAEELIQLLKAKGLKYLDDFVLATAKQSEPKNSPELIRFLNEINGKGNFINDEEKFASLTNCLMNYLCLVVGKTAYRITECEIYYMDIEHQDPYVHCGDEQLTAGKLYLNKAGGVDITFGNPNYPAWGGILIRGIRNLKTNQYINKITEIVAEIFKSLGNIILHDNRVFLAELEPGQIKVEKPIQSTRVGLTKKEPDNDNFIDKPYRYIVELNPSHKFRDKEKVVSQLLSGNKISADDAKNILGYDKKQ